MAHGSGIKDRPLRQSSDAACPALKEPILCVSRLVTATMKDEVDLILALKAALREAERTRENALVAYRFHLGNHRVSVSGGAA